MFGLYFNSLYSLSLSLHRLEELAHKSPGGHFQRGPQRLPRTPGHVRRIATPQQQPRTRARNVRPPTTTSTTNNYKSALRALGHTNCALAKRLCQHSKHARKQTTENTQKMRETLAQLHTNRMKRAQNKKTRCAAISPHTHIFQLGSVKCCVCVFGSIAARAVASSMRCACWCLAVCFIPVWMVWVNGGCLPYARGVLYADCSG